MAASGDSLHVWFGGLTKNALDWQPAWAGVRLEVLACLAAAGGCGGNLWALALALPFNPVQLRTAASHLHVATSQI